MDKVALMRQAINDTTREMGMPPYEINNSQCEEFALKIVSKVKGAEDVCTENFVEFGSLPGHVWILFEGKHYDAECIDGVDNFLELPIFQRARGGKSAHRLEVEAMGDELTQLPTAELKKRARSVWEAIYITGCYGTNDLRELDALEAELYKRGYVLETHERVVVVKSGV